ncbi:DUF417 family protein [Elizabethkingia anophelis]|uniref:DUF417 family protein n=1 Tax=Elizabethkingia anophelis TaxID=1117645 RepID=UPI00099B08A3|nr:DUF417 family protein [Elizabethkingia anophelis]MCT3897909.1 YkgB family protein [Elizabethkingia anophelis]MCT4285771.1 YkgB family protein [Elizabethkingia anophelis]MDV3547924.1 DUF417 domain-containing protein [Elizabethkingia anophelis]MDV3563768.1 DUF417 domain-containing protein [Elizabethkingia anophelis]MDV3567301.1 DUF417 domain-containing protein [Elizabethkingia anophelis]
MKNLLHLLVNRQHYFINILRISVFIVMAWIGGLKAFQYEADGIVPFVANSPFMSFLYQKKAPEYQDYKNPEGKMLEKNIEWNKANGTYIFAYGLGTVIVLIGLLNLGGIWIPKFGLYGGILTFLMSLVTLSFLITTPEVYVPDLGGDFPTPQYGFPYLSGAGRLVLKDIIMMAAGLVTASESARQLLKKQFNI